MTADKKLDMLQAATGVLFILFLLGAALQVWQLHKSPIPAIVTVPSPPLGRT